MGTIMALDQTSGNTCVWNKVFNALHIKFWQSRWVCLISSFTILSGPGALSGLMFDMAVLTSSVENGELSSISEAPSTSVGCKAGSEQSGGVTIGVWNILTKCS